MAKKPFSLEASPETLLSGNQISADVERFKRSHFESVLQSLNSNLKQGARDLSLTRRKLHYKKLHDDGFVESLPIGHMTLTEDQQSSLGSSVLFSSTDLEAIFLPSMRFEMQLHSYSTSKMRSEVHRYNSAQVVLQDQMGGSLPAVASQTIFGKFDRFILRTFSKSLPNAAVYFKCDPDVRVTVPYATRSRTLLPVGLIPESNNNRELLEISLIDRANSALAIVKVGLQWPGARLIFSSWIKKAMDSHPSLNIDAFLSSGWEDWFLIIGIKGNATELSLDQIPLFIEQLNRNRLVNSTETHWTTRLFDLDLAQDQAPEVRFLCRCPAVQFADQQSNFYSTHEVTKMLTVSLGAVPVSVVTAYGDYDFEITCNGSWADNKRLLHALYDFDGLHRIETIVGFATHSDRLGEVAPPV